jgi:hypothetical protein
MANQDMRGSDAGRDTLCAVPSVVPQIHGSRNQRGVR